MAQKVPGYRFALSHVLCSAIIYTTSMMQFDWDETKAESNLRTCHVAFEDATTVFDDPLAVIFYDERHVDNDVRELIIGHAATHQLLVVVFAERRGVLRIIGARRATPRERKYHDERTLF